MSVKCNLIEKKDKKKKAEVFSIFLHQSLLYRSNSVRWLEHSVSQREIKHQHRREKEYVSLLFDKLNLFIMAGSDGFHSR